jgi:Domain of unknown function (DUF1707)
VNDTNQSRLRASDADRDAVVTELGQHFQAGRLDAAELDDRTGLALRAKVRGDLDALLADLPRPAAPPQPAAPAPAGAGRPPLARALVPALIAAALLTAALTAGALSGGWHHQWGGGVGWWPVFWLIPLLTVRLLWWGRRPGRARSWR